MFVKYNSKGQVLEICITTSVSSEIFLAEGEFLLEAEDIIELDVSSYYIDNENIYAKPVKPNNYSQFNWELKTWEDPIDLLPLAKTDYKLTVNTLAGDKILAQYPTYRQMNYNREPLAQATIDMNLWIDGIRAESNVATSSIDLATDLATIEGIVDGFIAYLAGL